MVWHSNPPPQAQPNEGPQVGHQSELNPNPTPNLKNGAPKKTRRRKTRIGSCRNPKPTLPAWPPAKRGPMCGPTPRTPTPRAPGPTRGGEIGPRTGTPMRTPPPACPPPRGPCAKAVCTKAKATNQAERLKIFLNIEPVSFLEVDPVKFAGIEPQRFVRIGPRRFVTIKPRGKKPAITVRCSHSRAGSSPEASANSQIQF